jgi:cytidyltransferase-like protein
VILSPDDLVWLREKNCVLLDGAFDPLHSGHVSYFTDAIKAFPSHLCVVAVASDDDIRAKGREPLLDQQTRCAVEQAATGGGYVIAKNGPTEHLIARLKPSAYVKGADWNHRLPPEQLAACALHGVKVLFMSTVTDSSTDRLRSWALKDADAGLDRLETFIAGQSSQLEKFDTEYFQGDWRADGNTYTYEKRKEIEGQHPALIAECFPGLTILDVGCGPGYLVRMLKELGVDAGGCDPSADAVKLAADETVVHIHVDNVPTKICHVAICREVLEHVEVLEIPAMVADLFRVASKFVYITTRHHDGSLFDAATDFETDPTHVSLLTQPFLRSLCVLNGGKRRRDLEATLDHQNKGRCLVYEV